MAALGITYVTTFKKLPEFRSCSNCDECVTIDAGEIVWSVAFGTSSPERKPHSIETNFQHIHIKDLILATGLASGRIRIWDVFTGKLMLELLDHHGEVRSLKFAPDGSLILVSAGRDATLKFWDLNNDGNMFKSLKCNTEYMNCVAFAPSANIIAAVGQNKMAAMYDISVYRHPRLLHKLTGHYHDVVSCDFSPDGVLVATASFDTRVRLFDAHTADILREFCHLFPPPRPIFASGSNDSYVRSLCFSQDGMHIASVCDDGFIRTWGIFEEDVPVEICNVANALCCSHSPDGAILSVGTNVGTVEMYLTRRHVESLSHLCRLAVRRITDRPKVDRLSLPISVKQFLKYEGTE